jgi:hypothetical protein
MLHAVIRTQRDDALHFLGEVNSYNLQTLQFYVRDTAAEGAPVRVQVEISAEDQPAFEQHARRWLRRLADRGISLDLRVTTPARPAPEGPILRARNVAPNARGAAVLKVPAPEARAGWLNAGPFTGVRYSEESLVVQSSRLRSRLKASQQDEV